MAQRRNGGRNKSARYECHSFSLLTGDGNGKSDKLLIPADVGDANGVSAPVGLSCGRLAVAVSTEAA